VSADPYALCRYVQHYHRKNGYAPRLDTLGLSIEEAWLFIGNGIIEVLPLCASGPPVGVVLTDKGRRMAAAPLRRRGSRASAR
jgi:hypothetical protein